MSKTISLKDLGPEIEGALSITIPKPDIPIPKLTRLTICTGEASSTAVTTPPKLGITALADELLLVIFELLIVESSVCLGLTCKKFYNIHKTVWGKVELLKHLDFWKTQTSEHIDIRLYDLLQDWMGHGMAFDYKRRDPKFVTAAGFAARKARRRALTGYAPVARNDMENVCGDIFKGMENGVDPPFDSLLEWAGSRTGYEQLSMMTGTDLHSASLMGFARQQSYFGHKQGERLS